MNESFLSRQAPKRVSAPIHIGVFGQWLLSCLATFLLAMPAARAAEAEPNQVLLARTADTNNLETLRSYLQLQEQLHATQLAIEENRKEASAAAAHSAEVVANRLQAIEQSLAAQRAREFEAMQSSNRVILVVAGGIVVLGLAAMVLMGFSHWRAMNRLGDIATALPLSRRLEAGEPLAALGPGEALVSVGPGQVEETNGRLLGVIDRLEKRICELEQVAQAGEKGLSNGNGAGSAHGGSAEDRAVTLLGKGQTLMSLDKLEEALDCFEQILAENPDHAEALVKKGSVLERLRRVDEAIACYDQAIASGELMTVAYLHKGGLYNRLERYTEALECYEKALKTQEKAG